MQEINNNKYDIPDFLGSILEMKRMLQWTVFLYPKSSIFSKDQKQLKPQKKTHFRQ